MTRVLHVIHSLDPRSGGPAMSMRRLLQAQRTAGLNTRILATRVQSAEPWRPEQEYVAAIAEEECFRGSALFLARSWGRSRPWSVYAWSPDGRRELKKVCTNPDTRPDVIHIHGIFSHITESAAGMATKLKIPYVLRPAGCLDPGCLDRGKRGLKQVFLRWTLNHTLQNAAFIHAMSRKEADGVRQLVPDARVEIVPHGVELSLVNEQAGGASHEIFQEVGDQPYALCVSRLHEIKRLDIAIRAIHKVAMADLHLVLAGNDGGEMEKLKSLSIELGMGDRVHFPGFVKGEPLQQLYENARLFVHCSEHENFGLSVVEAMAQGVPVVVSQGVAASEFITESKSGVVVESSVDSVTNGIRDVLDQPKAMGDRGRTYVSRNLTWDSVVQRLHTLYLDVTNNGVTGSECHAKA